jgi:hypothetical protein
MFYIYIALYVIDVIVCHLNVNTESAMFYVSMAIMNNAEAQVSSF